MNAPHPQSRASLECLKENLRREALDRKGVYERMNNKLWMDWKIVQVLFQTRCFRDCISRLSLFLLCLSLVGCETVTDDEGRRTTRFDAAAATSIINTGFNTYDRYQRQAQIVGYAPDGSPIYRQQ